MTEHYTPSQAEGERDDEEPTTDPEPGATPSQAEGERDDEEPTGTGGDAGV